MVKPTCGRDGRRQEATYRAQGSGTSRLTTRDQALAAKKSGEKACAPGVDILRQVDPIRPAEPLGHRRSESWWQVSEVQAMSDEATSLLDLPAIADAWNAPGRDSVAAHQVSAGLFAPLAPMPAMWEDDDEDEDDDDFFEDDDDADAEEAEEELLEDDEDIDEAEEGDLDLDDEDEEEVEEP
jgi:hypothetical protein